MNRHTKWGTRAFTLVEMLAVMGIIVILLGVTLPALRGYNTSESRHSAVGAVMATLDRARMMAIADGKSTYVVFLGYSPNSVTPLDSTFNQNAFGRAYAIFEDYDNIKFQPVQQTPWMLLPTAMSFKVVASTLNGSNGSLVLTDSVTNRPLNASDPSFPITRAVLAGTSSATTKSPLPYLKFDSTGIADEQDPNYLRVLMFPGVVSNASSPATEIPTQVANTQASQVAMLEEIDVNPATGRAKYIVNPALNFSTVSGQ